MDKIGKGGGNPKAAQQTLLQAAAVIDQARALSLALATALASSPKEELSEDEIDSLCNLAYELFEKLDKIKIDPT